MLAKVSTSVRDLLAQFTKRFPPPVAFLAEYKYDGQRALIHHLPDGQVKIFSRNCEDKTEAFPDVVDVIRAAAAAGAHVGKSFIVDAEIVAVQRPVGGSVTPTTSHTNEASESKETSTAALKESTTTDAASGAKSDKVPVAASRGASAEGSAVAELELLPMQMLATRARGSVDAKGLGGTAPWHVLWGGDQGIKTAVCVFLFDLLCVGEHSAASDSLRQRRQLLRETLPDMVPGYIELARSVELRVTPHRTDDVDVEEATQAFLLESLAGQCEGLVVKVLDGAVYEPGRRADSWMKLKKDYIDGMADSLDLVPIGAWYGNGRKAGWFSPWLMAAQDPDSGELQSVCRVMSGFTDVFYKEATERFKGRIIEAPRAYYVTGESPNVWFDAAEVWELRGAELTISPVHKAGVGFLSAEKGLSLRFPRFLRVRHDKQVEEATSGAQLAQLYRQQTRRQKPLSGGAAKEAAAQGRAAVGGCEAARTDDGGTGDSSAICDGDDDVRESDGEGSAGCDDDVAVGDVLADILGDSDDSDGDDAQ